MATGYTQHYGLCQWSGEDKFLREEFNGDNRRVDEALRAMAETCKRALAGQVSLHYNVYNLMLQSYYDGKHTGYKKALVFDGFQDGSMVASLSGGLQRGSGLLTLQGTGMGDIDLGYGAMVGYSTDTGGVTATGSGTLQGFTYRTHSDVTYTTQLIVQYTLTLNGVVAASGTNTFNSVPGQTTVTRSLSLSVPVKSGDRFSLSLTTNSGSAHHFVQGGIFRVSSASGQNGRMTGKGQALPACGGLVGWVRFQNGAVSLSVSDGGGSELALEETERRAGINLQGAACTEASFRLDQSLAAGTLKVLLDAALNGAASMEIYDYGVALI